ncbi:MAG: MaoC family dehydratase [Rhodospirillaceae bacterium]|nr:MaoC family dehydratase [Rhodospirillaceae bacterium]
MAPLDTPAKAAGDKKRDKPVALVPDFGKEVHGLYLEDLSVGMTAVYTKTVTDADIQMFAGVSGDTNPLHLSDDFAETSMFEGRIAHGMLSASFISTLIGTRLPGPGAIYMGQTLKFLAPVRPGQTVNTRATVKEIVHDKARITLHTQCMVGDEVVIEGEATIKVPMRNPPAK